MSFMVIVICLILLILAWVDWIQTVYGLGRGASTLLALTAVVLALLFGG